MRNLFVSSSGAIVRVERVDDSYATIVTLLPTPAKYMMPKKEYDTVFVRSFRPATEEDLEALNQEYKTFKLPANAPDDWK
jgi:hypothetical protein